MAETSSEVAGETVKEEAPKEIPKEEEGTTIEEDLDATNEYVATKWDQINRNVDMFFTNQGHGKVKTRSSVFVYTSFYKKEGEKAENEYDFQLKFDLPNTTKKLKIIIEKQQDEISDALSDTSSPNEKSGTNSGPNTRRNNSSYTAGASFLLKQTKTFMSNLSFGIRLDMPLNPNVKLDLKKDIKTKFANIGLLQKVIYYRQEGLQNVSQLSFNKKLSKNFQTDFVHSLVWTDESDMLLLRNTLVLYQDLGDEKGLSYSVGANARFSPVFYYHSYDTSVSYRQLLYSSWLYGTLTLGAEFPKDRQFDDRKFVLFRLDIFFKEKNETI